MNKNIKKYGVFLIVGLFAMGIIPGEGTKASDQQAIVPTDYNCVVAEDCPVCVGGWFGADDSIDDDLTFLGELAYADCEESVCQLSEYCVVWDCGGVDECSSVKQTLLDNTIGRFNENPKVAAGILALGLVLLLL